MSAAESPARSGATLGLCAADVLELAAYAEASADARRRVAGLELPPCGHCARSAEELALSTRPARWLILSAPAAPGTAAARWARACAGQGAVVDLSSAFALFYLAGPEARAILARGCRLDLDPQLFRIGRAAASIIAQVVVVLAALPGGMLLLTPYSTARHFGEWLGASGAGLGLTAGPKLSLAELCGEGWQ